MVVKTREQALWYLAGMIDGEGSITYSEQHGNRSIVICSTDEELIVACETCCNILGYHHRRYGSQPAGPNRRYMWRLVLNTYGTILAASQELPLQHNTKREKLEQLSRSYKKVAYVDG